MGEIEFHDENNLTLTEYTHLNPNSSIGIPKLFAKTFVNQFTGAKYPNLYRLVGDKFSKKGFKGSPFGDACKNTS